MFSHFAKTPEGHIDVSTNFEGSAKFPTEARGKICREGSSYNTDIGHMLVELRDSAPHPLNGPMRKRSRQTDDGATNTRDRVLRGERARDV